MYYVCLVLLGYGLYIVHGFVNLVVASLKPPHFGCKNELVGDPKKKSIGPFMSRINVIYSILFIFASIFYFWKTKQIAC